MRTLKAGLHFRSFQGTLLVLEIEVVLAYGHNEIRVVYSVDWQTVVQNKSLSEFLEVVEKMEAY